MGFAWSVTSSDISMTSLVCPHLFSSPGKSAVSSKECKANQSTGDQRAEKWQRFFISPKHHFSNLPLCYYGYHMTSELVSTETAIVKANKHTVYPGAFINN